MLESKQVKQNNSLESDVGGESDTKEKNYQDLTFFFFQYPERNWWAPCPNKASEAYLYPKP